MTNKLDERLSHCLTNDGMGCDYVGDREKRKQDPYPNDLQRLQYHIFPAESGQSFVPYRCEELLHIGMCHELKQKFIVVLSSKVTFSNTSTVYKLRERFFEFELRGYVVGLNG